MPGTREAVLNAIALAPDDFVVEVGGGHAPFTRASVIFDKYPFDNFHRSFDLVYPVPVFIADANRMPVPDGGCELVFASHVLEHLPAPDRFLEEVRRVSRRVYLEFPGRNRELLFGWSMHEWLIEARGTHLVFYRNDIPQLFGDLFHRHYDAVLDAWMLQRHPEINTSLLARSAELTWEFASIGAFEHVVATSPKGKDKVNFAEPAAVPYTPRQVAVVAARGLVPHAVLEPLARAARRRGRGAPPAITRALLDRLACPDCRHPGLRLEAEHLSCGACGRRYGKRGGLFDLDVLPDTEPVTLQRAP